MKILISDGLAQKGIDLLSSVSEFEVEFRPGLSAAELKVLSVILRRLSLEVAPR